MEKLIETAAGVMQNLYPGAAPEAPASGRRREPQQQMARAIADPTRHAMLAGALLGAAGAMFASSAMLVTLCAAGLYCRVYWVFVSSASRPASALGCTEELSITVAAMLMLPGCACNGWFSSLLQLCLSLLAMAAHLRWLAAGTGLGQYYLNSSASDACTIQQLLWSSATDQSNQLNHATPLVCPGSSLAALAAVAIVTCNPVTIGVLLIELRLTIPHQMAAEALWKLDSFFRAVLKEQAKVMSRLDPQLVKSLGGSEVRAFAERFEIAQLEVEKGAGKDNEGRMWWRGCSRQASGQCDALRLTATLGLNLPPCCRAHLTELIEQVSSLLTELEIPHWADGSTLLAACRHKTLLPWASHVKITFVPPNGASDHVRLLRGLRYAGFTVFTSADGQKYNVMWGRGPWLCFGDAEMLRCAVGASPRLTISAVSHIDDDTIGVFRESSNKELLVPRSVMLPTSMIQLYGVYIGMPKDAHQYLTLRYGEHWNRMKYSSLHHTYTGGKSHSARAAVDSIFLANSSATVKSPEKGCSLPLEYSGMELTVELGEDSYTTQDLSWHLRNAIGIGLGLGNKPLVLRSFCYSPGYPMDVVARNPAAFKDIKHTVTLAEGGVEGLPASLVYDRLHEPSQLAHLVSQLHTRGWAVLKLSESERHRIEAARRSGHRFFDEDSSEKQKFRYKASGSPSGGWGGVEDNERRESFTYHPFWSENDRAGWRESSPEWMASVEDVHELVDSIGMRVLLAVGKEIGLEEEYLRGLADPHTSTPWSHGSFVKYFMYTMGGGATPCCPEHADHSLLTVSLCSQVPELAVLDRLTGEWIMVEENADELDVIVFPGYYLSMLTCGYFHAPLHRVMHSTGEDRMSILYFLRTAQGAILDPSLVQSEYLGACEFDCDRSPASVMTLIRLVNDNIPHQLSVV